ncbi:MAG: undecaprenyl-diphosphate phosphatase [Solirubrobacteraceae bacterium]
MRCRTERRTAPTLVQALALGALHGPAELLPISSSGHVTAIPWLLGCDDADPDGPDGPDGRAHSDPELRKAFEVALHAGTAAALLITLRAEVSQAARNLSGRRAGLILLSFAPPAVVGYALERQIERRTGTPATVAAGLICGSLAMALADRAAQTRAADEAGVADALWLGVAQTCALIPGVSRNGATLAAARARRFTREDANRLSRYAALPVIGGATALMGVRLARRGLPRAAAAPFAAGAAASFASTLACTWLIGQVERDRSLLPYACYRVALAGLIVRRLRRLRTARF